MTQAVTKIMAATIGASARGLDVIDKARRKKGWTKTAKVWADLACTTSSTLKRFWAGIAIQTSTFQAICETVGIENWESVADLEDEPASSSQIGSKRLCFAIAGSIEEIDKHKLDAMVALLRKMGGDASIEILDIDEGSIKLILGGSPEALARIEALFQSGQLEEIADIAVQDVHFLGRDELSQMIKKNGGEVLNLIGADLSRAKLHRADLSKADLTGADLTGADLSKADLIGSNLHRADLSRAYLIETYLIETYLIEANLHKANLRGAYLHGANLRGAYLYRANLRGAYLYRANLIEANLIEADLSRADLSRADLSRADLSRAKVTQARFGIGIGLSEQSKQDLIQRGAIFVDAPGEKAFIRSPVPSGRR